MLSDIEIAQATQPEHIRAIAEKAGVAEEHLELYGNYKAKVDYNLLVEDRHEPGKLVLVTAINPTPAGEGKTTTTVGLADALRAPGQETRWWPCASLPSAPCSASRAALPAAATPRSFPWRTSTCTSPATSTPSARPTTCWPPCWTTTSSRATHWASTCARSPGSACVDMNDRQLRNVVDGLGGKANGMPREDGFDITVASEIMAVLLPGHVYHRPEGAPGPHRRGLHLRRQARHGRRPAGAGRHGGAC